MRSLVPRTDTDDSRRNVRRAALRAVAALSCAAAVLPASASAAPVRAKATPLAVFTSGAPQRCPSAGEVSGQRVSALAAQSARSGGIGGMLAFGFYAFLPTPAVVLCDPELLRTPQPLGPFGGATHYGLTADIATQGVRALGTSPEEFTDSELVPGDRVELPAASGRAVLTVVAATRNGAATVELPPLGMPRATAVRIEGALDAPVIAVERESGEPTRTPVPRPKGVITRVVPRLHGREVRFHGTAAPGALITGGADEGGDAVVAASSGRFKGLSVEVGPRNRSVAVFVSSLPRRQAFAISCKVRWNAKRRLADRITCDAVKAATGARAVRAAAALAGTRAAAPTSSSARAASSAPRATAAQAPPTVEASVTRVATFPSEENLTLAGDVNGDGRPEVVANPAYDGPARPRLLVSRASGVPTPIPVRVDDEWFDLLLDINTVPDLDGDGRDELVSPNGMLVTDALAAPALPARLDLRSMRPTSPRDLDLGLDDRDSALTSLLTAGEPRGSVQDSTGDGRPEIVLGNDGITAVYASQSIVPGIRSRLAQIFPLAWLDEVTVDELDDAFDAEPRDAQASAAVDAPGERVIGRRLVTLRPADPSIAPTQPRTFLLEQFGGGPTPLATTSFAATGIPLLLDFDPASGDALVALFQRVSCGRRRCLDRVLRLNAAGAATSVIATRRAGDELFGAFIADGPDPDAAVDVALSLDAGLGGGPVRSSGSSGTIAVLTSSQTGARTLASLPVLARGGKPVQAFGPLTSVALPNGSRWLAAQTGVRNRSRTGVYALVGQRP